MTDEAKPIYTHEKNTIYITEEVIEATRKGQIAFDRAIVVQIRVPGDNTSNMNYKAKIYYQAESPHPIYGKVWKNEDIYRRFGKYLDEWEANHGEIAASGTPVDNWPVLNKSQVALLKFNGIHTVEALQNLTDSQLPALGLSARSLVQQAKDWVETKRNSAHVAAIKAEKDAIEARLLAIEERLEEQKDFLDEAGKVLTEEQRAAVQNAVIARRRGRPPKNRDVAA